jgi:hypothetical protein
MVIVQWNAPIIMTYYSNWVISLTAFVIDLHCDVNNQWEKQDLNSSPARWSFQNRFRSCADTGQNFEGVFSSSGAIITELLLLVH